MNRKLPHSLLNVMTDSAGMKGIEGRLGNVGGRSGNTVGGFGKADEGRLGNTARGGVFEKAVGVVCRSRILCSMS